MLSHRRREYGILCLYNKRRIKSMDGGNAKIIAAVIAAVASLVSAGIALYNAKDSKKGAAQRDEVNNRTNSEIAMFEQDA